MAELTQKVSNSKIGALLIGGSIAVATLSGLYYLRRKNNDNNQKAKFTEEEVYDILVQFKRDFYQFWKDLSNTSKRCQSELAYQFRNEPETIYRILYETLVEKNPNFENTVNQIEFKILAKNNVSDPDAFKDASENYAKKSARIKKIQDDIKNHFNLAITGVVPPINVQTPNTLTAEDVLEVFILHIQDLCRSVAKINKDFRESHLNPDFNSLEYRTLISKANVNTNFDKILDYVPQNLKKEYHPEQLFLHFFVKLVQTNPKIDRISLIAERQNQAIIVEVHKPECDFDKIELDIQNIGKEPVTIVQTEILDKIELQKEEAETRTVQPDSSELQHNLKEVEVSKHVEMLDGSFNTNLIPSETSITIPVENGKKDSNPPFVIPEIKEEEEEYREREKESTPKLEEKTVVEVENGAVVGKEDINGGENNAINDLGKSDN